MLRLVRKKSSESRGAAKLSSQIDKLCNVVGNISQATFSLILIMDSYDIRRNFQKLVHYTFFH